MKNIFRYKLVVLAVVLVSIVSCDLLREAEQDAAPVVSPDGNTKIVTTSTNITGNTIAEGDTLLFKISIDETIDRAITFNAKILSGNLDENDIEVIPGVIQPYTKEAAVTVIFLPDWDVESAESVKFEFGVYGIAEKYLLHSTTVFPVLDLTVNNYVADNYILEIEWGQEVTVWEEIEKTFEDGNFSVDYLDTVEVVTDASDEVDYDFLICPVEGFDISNPWGNPVTYAATGDHPEVFELSGLEDGEYYIAYDLWANGFISYVAVEDTTVLLNATSSMVRQGTDLDAVVTALDSQSPTILTPGYDDNEIGKTGVVAKLIVDGDNYSIVDYDEADGLQFASKLKSASSRPYIEKKKR